MLKNAKGQENPSTTAGNPKKHLGTREASKSTWCWLHAFRFMLPLVNFNHVVFSFDQLKKKKTFSFSFVQPDWPALAY